MDINKIWQKTLELLENEVSFITYQTWFLAMKPVKLTNDTFIFEVNDGFVKRTIDNKYLNLIQNALAQVINRNISITTYIKGNEPAQEESEQKSDLNEHNIRNLNGLTQKYRFDNFVVGSSNKLAYSAAVAVSEMPGEAYNPLFLYGGVGLGKTHLMNSIGNEALENTPNLNIAYISCENFMNELIEAIRTKKGAEFRSKYRKLDFLLIDDIQFISEKTQTQEEFFHTFNELTMNNKQIVISSDRPPSEIEQLADRLESRFQQGLVVDIKLPDFETRTAILQAKAKSLNYEIPDDVIQYIAQNIKSNIRELEGVLNRVIFYSKIYPGNITIDMAENAVEDILKMNKPKITIEYIQEIVAAHYGVSTDDLKGKTRTKKLALARQVSMYLCRKMLDINYKEIGRKFGNKDHSTVISAYNKIENLADEDEDIKNTLINLEKKINNQ
ncbi:MAG: chromosomal replication initiator protein DnaA [Firmicutes bacterium]|nr:chromosomal replication initiator protein DnaA [Bacillota bacterium]